MERFRDVTLTGDDGGTHPTKSTGWSRRDQEGHMHCYAVSHNRAAEIRN